MAFISLQIAKKLWRNGGNWVVFAICWIISSAIIGAIESTPENVKLDNIGMKEVEVQSMAGGLTHLREFLDEKDEVGRAHLEKVIKLLERSEFPRIWAQGEDYFDEHIEVLKLKIKLIQEEFENVRNNLAKGDIVGQEIVKELLDILKDGKTLGLLDKVNKMQHKMMEEAHEYHSDLASWNFGDSLHFISSVFTTTGYGFRSPLTAGGKFFTVLVVLTLLPFFLHCLACTANNINILLDRVLGISENYDDMEDSNHEKSSNAQLRKMAILKGSAILFAFLVVHLLISALYHYFSTGWNFGDIIYFEFISYSTIGFGDMLPEDEMTVGGAILKNVLLRIPAAVLLLALFLRLLPVIS